MGFFLADNNFTIMTTDPDHIKILCELSEVNCVNPKFTAGKIHKKSSEIDEKFFGIFRLNDIYHH